MYMPGQGWLADAGFSEQPSFAEQLDYWRAKEREGVLVELAETRGSHVPAMMVAWRCDDLGTAKELAARSPLVAAGIARATTGPGTLDG